MQICREYASASGKVKGRTMIAAKEMEDDREMVEIAAVDVI